METVVLPFTPSDASYRFNTTLADTAVVFDVHWNADDAAWYIDIREFDDTPIACGLKLALGAFIGRFTSHVIFHLGTIFAIDTARGHREARFDDLGTRVVVLWVPYTQVARGFASI